MKWYAPICAKNENLNIKSSVQIEMKQLLRFYLHNAAK